MSRRPDIVIVSLGTTLGWQAADQALAAQIRSAGASCEIVEVPLGRAAILRRSMAMTDAVEGLAARRAAEAGPDSRAVIYSSITAALLQRPRRPYAVRFDTLAAMSRPGAGGWWQRRREPRVLAGARLLLPWGGEAAERAQDVLAGCRGGEAHPGTAGGGRVVTLPVPIEPPPARGTDSGAVPACRRAGPGRQAPDAVAYAGNPGKRGLDLLCRAWELARRREERLLVGGIEPAAAEAWLARQGLTRPSGLEWTGRLPRDGWLSLVAASRVFVSASRYEDWGIAPLEALSAGAVLCAVPAQGPNEALGLARELVAGPAEGGEKYQALISSERSPRGLARAIRAGLDLDDTARTRYVREARRLLAPYRPEAVAATVAEEVLPRLLSSES